MYGPQTVLYKSSELRLVWEHFEAVDNETPHFRIRYWWTAECTNWENPMPVRVFRAPEIHATF